jgi:hypothetical protein
MEGSVGIAELGMPPGGSFRVGALRPNIMLFSDHISANVDFQLNGCHSGSATSDIGICDGGPRFWSVEYDVDDHRFTMLSHNGAG